jgi:hypothetical protein
MGATGSDATEGTFEGKEQAREGIGLDWLKADAPENIACMFVTDAVFHAPTIWLNALAPANICCMLLTDATFHLPMSALNVGRL